MSRELTDRDERSWQRRAEERVADPLPIGAWIRRLRAAATPKPRTGRGRYGVGNAVGSAVGNAAVRRRAVSRAASP